MAGKQRMAYLEDEWSVFTERNHVVLRKVIGAIKTRPTHSNIPQNNQSRSAYNLFQE